MTISSCIPNLEIPKLFDEDIETDENDPIVQWIKFLDAKSKGKMEMLTEKSKDIKKENEKARMLYESRQAEISDQLTRLKSEEEKGATEKVIKIAEKMIIKGFSIDDIAVITDLTVERLTEIKNNMVH